MPSSAGSRCNFEPNQWLVTGSCSEFRGSSTQGSLTASAIRADRGMRPLKEVLEMQRARRGINICGYSHSFSIMSINYSTCIVFHLLSSANHQYPFNANTLLLSAATAGMHTLMNALLSPLLSLGVPVHRIVSSTTASPKVRGGQCSAGPKFRQLAGRGPFQVPVAVVPVPAPTVR